MTRPGTLRRLALLCAALARASTQLPLASAADVAPTAPNGWAAALGEADRRFVAGDLAGALEVLQPVCSTSERPECAFALGAIQHGLGHCEEARGHYRRYRELAPRGEHSAEVEAALEEVERQCGDAAQPPAPPSPAPPEVDTAQRSALSPIAGPPEQPPVPVAAPEPSNRALVIGSFGLSGAAAASSLIFGILAARSASHCEHAAVYDRSFIDECEDKGPRYQALWQGFAVASGSFLGIGLTLWWLDARSNAAIGVAGAGVPTLQYQRRF